VLERHDAIEKELKSHFIQILTEKLIDGEEATKSIINAIPALVTKEWKLGLM